MVLLAERDDAVRERLLLLVRAAGHSAESGKGLEHEGHR